MLILKRKENESVTINTTDGTIVITVLRFRWGKVDLSIEAPKEIEITRTEILKKTKKEVEAQ